MKLEEQIELLEYKIKNTKNLFGYLITKSEAESILESLKELQSKLTNPNK